MTRSAPWSFRLELNVIEDVVYGHHRRLGPLLDNLRMGIVRSLKLERLPLDRLSQGFKPRAVTAHLGKLQQERRSGDHVALREGGAKFGVNVNFDIHRLSFRLRQVTVP